MTIVDLGRAIHKARNGHKIVFVTKNAPVWLFGFLKQVSDPSRIYQSMRKAEWKGGGWIIVTDKVDRLRQKEVGIEVIDDEDCALGEYATYLAEQKGVWLCSK